MQGFRLAAISDVEKTKLRRKCTNGRTEIWTPISHPAISRCDKNSYTLHTQFYYIEVGSLHGHVFLMVRNSFQTTYNF